MFLLELGIKCEQEHIFSAGHSGIRTIIEMGYPTCHLYISDDLKKDYGIFKLDVNDPEIVVIGDYEKWDFELLNQAFSYVMNGSQIFSTSYGEILQGRFRS